MENMTTTELYLMALEWTKEQMKDSLDKLAIQSKILDIEHEKEMEELFVKQAEEMRKLDKKYKERYNKWAIKCDKEMMEFRLRCDKRVKDKKRIRDEWHREHAELFNDKWFGQYVRGYYANHDKLHGEQMKECYSYSHAEIKEENELREKQTKEENELREKQTKEKRELREKACQTDIN